jgi:hypothetical protein
MDERSEQAGERPRNVETKPELLAQLKDEAHQREISLFAYLAHFVSQDNERIRGRGPVLE